MENVLHSSIKQLTILPVFQPIFIFTLSVFLILILYQQVIHPLVAMQFYSDQGIQCEFIPFAGSSPKDSRNVEQKGDYYFDWLEKAQRKNKPKLFCKNVGSVCSLILLDPQLIQELFINKDDFIKHQFQNGLIKTLSPNGLVLIEGKLWKKHRKIISKGFQYQKIDSMVGLVQQISQSVIAGMCSTGQEYIENVFNFFKQKAGNIISLVYFQEDIISLRIDEKSFPVYLSDLIADLSCQSYNWRYCIFGKLGVHLKLFESQRILLARIKKVRQLIRKIIHKHARLRSQKKNQGCFSMWDIFLSEEAKMSQDQIIDEFITFFSDGVYTTGHFMMMLSYYLAKNPWWKDRLTEQLKQNLYRNKNPNQSLINSLPIYNACMRETLRLVPPVVTGIERIAVKDTTFSDGTKIKKDTMIFACHLVNHMNEDFHQDAKMFKPDRWLNPSSRTLETIKKYPGSFVPFSIGQRHCPGQKFAMVEAAIFLTQFLANFTYEITNQSTYVLKFTQRFLREPLEAFGFSIKKKIN